MAFAQQMPPPPGHHHPPKFSTAAAATVTHETNGKDHAVGPQMVMNGRHHSGPKKQHRQDDEEQGKLFVGGLSWDTTQDSLLRYFARFGEVIDCVVMKNADTGEDQIAEALYKVL